MHTPILTTVRMGEFSGLSDTLFELLPDLYSDQVFTDVTLVCDDLQEFEAHKVILCAGSNFFREFFSNNAKDHLTLYMRGIQKHQIMPLVQFLYCGETTVPDRKVKDILDIAKELEIEENENFELDQVRGTEIICTEYNAIQLPKDEK